MANSPPATKRKRTEPDDTAIKRGDPWFEDGNIVLQAETTQFKVYSGILSRQSEIFADMLTVPQPQSTEESVEGCAVVRLTDSAQDWTHALKAIFERR